MITPYDQFLARVIGFQPVLSQFDGITRAGRAFCPVCGHKQRKLEIAESVHGGALLLKCWRNCSAPEIMQALGLNTSDLFPKYDRLSQPVRNKVYPWFSASGSAAAVVEAGFLLSMSPPSQIHARQIELEYAVKQFQSAAKSAMRNSNKRGAK